MSGLQPDGVHGCYCCGSQDTDRQVEIIGCMFYQNSISDGSRTSSAIQWGRCWPGQTWKDKTGTGISYWKYLTENILLGEHLIGKYLIGKYSWGGCGNTWLGLQSTGWLHLWWLPTWKEHRMPGWQKICKVSEFGAFSYTCYVGMYSITRSNTCSIHRAYDASQKT